MLSTAVGLAVALGGSNMPAISAGPGGTLTDDALSPLNVSCSIQFETDFDITNLRSQDGNVDLGDWMSPAGWESAANYEIRATRTGGTDPSAGDVLDTWLALSTQRTWTNTRTSDTPGTVTSTLLIEIRRASDGIVVASASYTIVATVL